MTVNDLMFPQLKWFFHSRIVPPTGKCLHVARLSVYAAHSQDCFVCLTWESLPIYLFMTLQTNYCTREGLRAERGRLGKHSMDALKPLCGAHIHIHARSMQINSRKGDFGIHCFVACCSYCRCIFLGGPGWAFSSTITAPEISWC